MKLGQCIIRPGTVKEVVDNYGTIKATSPGLFSVEDSSDLLPPIVPFIQPNSNGFSSPKVDDTIWILQDESNSQLFMYIRFNQINQDIKTILDSGDENQEVVFSRDTDKGIYQLFFNDGTGIKIMKDESYIQIDPDGNINISSEFANRSISISSDSLCLGKSSDEAGDVECHVAYGEKVEAALTTIYDILSKIEKLARSNPYISSILPAFDKLSQLENQITEISSDDVKVV